MPTLTKLADSLDWPSSETPTATAIIQCAGKAFLEYQAVVAAADDFVVQNNEGDDCPGEDNNNSNSDEGGDNVPLVEDSSPAIDLFSLNEEELDEVDYYKVLHLPYGGNVTPDQVKKAYRKASLKYHPDKSGRDKEDVVFLKVKTAFEVLSTQKQAYDSTEMPFDDSLPDGGELSSSLNKTNYSSDDFFEDYKPCFERNLHFDARLLPNNNNSSNGGSNGGGGAAAKKNRRKSRQSHIHTKAPNLGDALTSIDKVHEFYDYWTHFETWRDFGLQAARELETTDHLENAESRYEKRWYQKEIDKRAKKLKQQEQARITTLVERAMAVDPRLIQERKRQLEEKQEKQQRKEQEALDKVRQEVEAKLEEERRMGEEKGRKAEEKLQREKEKKLLRKQKQAFRKLVSEAIAALGKNVHFMEDEIDFLCSGLDREQLIKLNANLESISSSPQDVLNLVEKRANNLRTNKEEEEEEEKSNQAAAAVNGHSTATASTKKKLPFTKDELTTLAKGVKKFPAGGNRWESIASYINSVCRPETPRTKEECIATFNQINKGVPKTTTPVQNGNHTAPNATKEAPKGTDNGSTNGTDNAEDQWTEEQDQLFQEALSKYPATLDKNTRWTNIAKCVPGKNKKLCVQRFKTIRDAIKDKK
jgi:DnaJ family protein C protein 2